jgi:hypothetical protein
MKIERYPLCFQYRECRARPGLRLQYDLTSPLCPSRGLELLGSAHDVLDGFASLDRPRALEAPMSLAPGTCVGRSGVLGTPGAGGPVPVRRRQTSHERWHGLAGAPRRSQP